MADALGRAAALLAHAGEGGPALAWAPVARPGLVLGRSAGPEPVDWEACARAGIGVHRRASGGGPVLWDDELVALDVVLPAGHRFLSQDVVASYRWLGEVLAGALRELGVAARAVPTAEARERVARRRDAPAAMACYGNLSPWEVIAGDRKLVGLAQVRRRAGALFQVGIPLRPGGAALARLLDLGGAPRDAFAADLDAYCPGLTGIDRSTLAGAIERSFGRLGITFADADLTVAERDTAVTAAAVRHAAITGTSTR